MNQSLALKTYPGMGRGVCATVPFCRGAIVEVAPVLPISAADWKLIKKTLLETYVFAWGADGKSNAIPLGYGGLFNHSDEPNVTFYLNIRQKWITFRARRDIEADEQLTIDYRWSAKDRKRYLGPNA